MTQTDFIYLDYAAATPVADFVLDAMRPYFSQKFFNPSSPYLPAVEVRREYEAAKQRLAETFGAKGNELIMTAGATESINLAFSFVSGHVVTTAIEHPAVLASARARQHSLVAVSETGIVKAEAVAAALTPDTQLVSVCLANSELGTLQPIRAIASVVTTERAKRAEQGNDTELYFHCDASQGFGTVELHAGRLGIDLLTLNASKIYGPKQVGLLWAKPSVRLSSVIVGGGQERGLRSGTENVAGVVGFSAAAVHAARHVRGEQSRMSELRDHLQSALAAHPRAVILGSKKHRLANFLSVSFPGLDAERLLFMLESRGVLVATGSACSANKHTASHVLTAIGLSDETIAGSMRISLGRPTTKRQIDVAAEAILEAAASEYARVNRRG